MTTDAEISDQVRVMGRAWESRMRHASENGTEYRPTARENTKISTHAAAAAQNTIR